MAKPEPVPPIPDVRVRAVPQGTRVTIFVRGKTVADVIVGITKPVASVSDRLYGLAIAFKQIADAAKEKGQ